VFRSLRLKLIAYVVTVLASVLLIVGVAVYILLTRQFDAAIDAQLRARLPSPPKAFAVSPSDVSGPVLAPQAVGGAAIAVAAGPPPPFDVTVSRRAAGNLSAPGTGSPADAGQESVFVGVSLNDPPAADGTFMMQLMDGSVVSRDDAAPSALPDLQALAAARAGRDDLRTVRAGGQRYRLLTHVMPALPGGPAVTLQEGISLATRDREERIVILALAGGGLLGILLTGAGSLLLTSRTLAPVQLAFERQSRFIADASHELRTPLALVRLEAEDLARRLHAADEVRPLLGQVNRVSRLVDSLLTLARLDNNVLAVELEPVHVASLVRAAAAAAGRLAAPGVSVTVTAPENVWIMADPDHLSQMLLILIDNACRVTPSGGAVRLTVQPDGAATAIAVSDDGPGIEPRHLAHVFERFYRADAARSRAHGGTGLGLAIAQELAQMQGGKIELASSAGGTTATIRLRSAAPLSVTDLPGDGTVTGAVSLQ